MTNSIKNMGWLKALKRESVYFYLLILFIATYPVSYIPNTPIIIFICAFFFIDTKENIVNKLKKTKGNWMIYTMILFVLVQAFGMIYTENTKRGWDMVIKALPMLFLPVVIISEHISKKKTYTVLNFLKFAMVVLFMYLCFYQWLVEKRPIATIVNFAYERQFGIGQIYPALLLVLAIMITIHQLFKKEQLKINLFVLIILLTFLSLFSSRLSIIVLGFSLVVFAHKNFKHIHWVKKIVFLCSGLVLVITIFYSSPGLRRKADILIKTTDFDIEIIKTKNSITFAKNTIEQRILINLSGFTVVKAHSLIGVGTGDYLDALLGEYNKLGFIAGKKMRFNTHNQYLEEYIKTGIFGFSIMIIMLFIMFKKSYKNQSFMFYCVFYVAFVCLFESFLSRHHGTAFIAFFIPLFYYIEENHNKLLYK